MARIVPSRFAATSAVNKLKLEAEQLERFRLGALFGFGPEVDAEEIVRAAMPSEQRHDRRAIVDGLKIAKRWWFA